MSNPYMRGAAAVRLTSPAMPKQPPAIKVTPAHNGAIVEHFPGGVTAGVNPPQRFLFTTQDGLLRHIAKTARNITKKNPLKGV